MYLIQNTLPNVAFSLCSIANACCDEQFFSWHARFLNCLANQRPVAIACREVYQMKTYLYAISNGIHISTPQ